MSDISKKIGEWTGFGIKMQVGHYYSLITETGNSYTQNEVWARRTASSLAIVGAGTVVYGAYELAQAINLV